MIFKKCATSYCNLGVKELLVKHIEIEAVDKETAQELLLRFYNNGAIVLDAEDFQEVEISIKGKK